MDDLIKFDLAFTIRKIEDFIDDLTAHCIENNTPDNQIDLDIYLIIEFALAYHLAVAHDHEEDMIDIIADCKKRILSGASMIKTFMEKRNEFIGQSGMAD